MTKKLSERLQELKKDLERSDLILHKLNQEGIYISNFFNLSNDLLVVAHSDGYFKITNSCWTKVTEYSPIDLISKKWIDFVHPDDIQSTLETGANLAIEPCYNFVNRYLIKDGTYITLSWNSRQTDDGIIYGCARVIG